MPSFDVVGDIAIIKHFTKSHDDIRRIAKDIIDKNHHIRTVLCQTKGIYGEYRIGKLEWLYGEKKTETICKENGCRFYLNLKSVYFSPRLSFERMRIAKEIKNKEIILNMFGGVGSYSLMIARYARILKIYSIDINPEAIRSILINIVLNKIKRKVVAILGDAEYITETYFSNKVNRVLMPLPERSFEFLPIAIKALENGRGIIHYYDFIHACKENDPIAKISKKIIDKMMELNVDFQIKYGKVVRSIGPNWYQIVLDIEVI